jgi:aminopeptidase N
MHYTDWREELEEADAGIMGGGLSGKLRRESAKRYWPAIVGSLLLLLGACSQSIRGVYTELNGYDLRDFKPYRGLLIEDEFAQHPELPERTVYHLHFEIAEPPGEITAGARIHFTNRSPQTIGEIPMFLYPNLTPGGLQVLSLTVDGQVVEPSYGDRRTRLLVQLPKELKPGRAASITVEYRLSLPVTEEGEYGGLGFAGDVLSLAYCYPMIPACEGWSHPLPAAYGDFVFNEVSFYLVEVSMPEKYVLAAPGIELGSRRLDGRREVVFAMGPARDLYLALSPEFTVESERVGDTEIRSYAREEDAAGSRQALAAAAAAVSGFGGRFGVYPYRTLSLVSVPFAAFGLEFPGILINARRLYDLGETYGGIPAQVLLESTTAHEVAHQWFYGSVGNDQLLEPWLDEAPAQYATWLYYADRYGDSAAQEFFRSLEARWERVDSAEIPIGRPVSEYTLKEYGAIVYGRGPLFLHALCERMGEDVFDAFLKAYTRTFEWEIVDSREFEQAAESACGCELENLFDQWLRN